MDIPILYYGLFHSILVNFQDTKTIINKIAKPLKLDIPVENVINSAVFLIRQAQEKEIIPALIQKVYSSLSSYEQRKFLYDVFNDSHKIAICTNAGQYLTEAYFGPLGDHRPYLVHLDTKSDLPRKYRGENLSTLVKNCCMLVFVYGDKTNYPTEEDISDMYEIYTHLSHWPILVFMLEKFRSEWYGKLSENQSSSTNISYKYFDNNVNLFTSLTSFLAEYSEKTTRFLERPPRSIHKKENNLVKILILTANEIEFRAMKETLEEKSQSQLKRIRKANYAIYTTQCISKNTIVYLVNGCKGTSGLYGSIITTLELIDAVGPNVIIVAGIAFGVHEDEDQRLGHILISDQIFPYEYERIGEKKLFRSPIPPASPNLVRIYNDLSLNDEEFKGRAHTGIILSGDKLFDDKPERDKLVESTGRAKDIVGGEMEAAGVFVAAFSRKIDWILIKAISDWGYKKTGKYKSRAAKNAAEFVCLPIQRGDFDDYPITK